MAKRSNFEDPFFLADDYDITVFLTQRDAQGVESALDLTGGSVRFAMGLDNATSPLVTLTSTPAAGVVIVDAMGGEIRVELRKATTATFPAGFLYHEAEFTDSGGLEETVLIGESIWRAAVLN